MSDDLEHDDDFRARFDWALWRQVLRFAKPYRRHLIAMSIVAMMTAACDVTVPFLTGRIIDEVTSQGGALTGSGLGEAGIVESGAARTASTTSASNDRLWNYGIAFACVMVFFAVNICCFIILAGTIATNIAYDIREAGFKKLQELSFSYYDKKAVGWLMSRMTSGCAALSRIMGWALLDIVWGVCMICFIAAVMLTLNWKLALIVLAITPVLLVVSRFFNIRILIASRRVRKSNSMITAAFNEGITGVRTTKSFVREEENLDEFQTLTDQMFGDSMAAALYAAVFMPLVLTLCSVGVGLALWFGGSEVIAGSISLGTLVIFIAYAGHLANPIQEMAQTVTTLQGAQASAERIQQLLDTEPEVKDSEAVLQRLAEVKAQGGPTQRGQAQEDQAQRKDEQSKNASDKQDHQPSLAMDGYEDRIEQIRFDNVGFAYKEGQAVLSDFDLRVNAGETVALVGPTGGGKSTIVNLMCRFYEPTRGSIRINDRDYRERSLLWLQSNLGMVLQSPHLFRESVRENIRYGRLEATDEEVEAAAKLVNAHDFILDLEEGYDTEVGEGGGKLSTGQKQLVSLARAILADPQILVMDEATSSVDTETEQLIQSGVERVLANRIAFVIAHRLSTIRTADQIVVIDAGRMVEQGTHDQLIALQGRYFQLYTHQYADEQQDHVVQGV